ncbi:hypothetical protein ACJ41O_004033 [Fusarium nematophilum]
MPTASIDKPQQSMASTTFTPSNIYHDAIWGRPSITNARERSIAPKGASLPSYHLPYSIAAQENSLPVSDSDDTPTGSNAFHRKSDAEGWRSAPWNNMKKPSRSTSSSPNRTRDEGIGNGSGFFDTARGMSNGFNGKTFQDDPSAYGNAFPPTKRSPQESSYMDSMAGYGSARDSNVPPSRQSQGSPSYDLYMNGRGHTPSNSIQSQRPMPTHSSSFQNQSVNQRAFNLNSQIEEDLALKFSRQVTLDNTTAAAAAVAGSSVNPASQPFQLDPGSQPWVNEGSAPPRFNTSVDLGHDPLAVQMPGMKRGSIDRISPGSNYHLEQGSSPRTIAPNPELWPPQTSSRDPRSAEQERRAAAQFLTSYAPPYYPNQFQYPNLPSQYHTNFIDPYSQAFRHHMMPGYGFAPLHAGYALSGNFQIQPARDQDPGKGVRSVLLDEFRISSKNNRRYELKDIYNHVVEFSGDQHGSRFIQQKLETANSDEKDQIFGEIVVNAVQLMRDVFGNYVIQKFFEHGNQVQKRVLAEEMKGKMIDLSTQTYACRVVQKALEHILVEQQAELIKELEPEITKVIRDANGNHVVQKIIESVPRRHLDFVMAALKGHVTAFATHAYGCRVIQRMLEYGKDDDKAKIMEELHVSTQMLITDQYGNYVAQHVIQNGKPEDREKIIQMVMSDLLNLSKHKFASNVVEKCIEYGSEQQRSDIRQQVSAVGPDGSSNLPQMIRDQYGNYVIQKLLGQLKGTEGQILVEDIKPHYYILKKSGTSRQLQALEKLLELGSGGPPTKNGLSGLQVDVNSSTATPVLTNESNSPQSTGPPSTNASAIDVPVDEIAGKTSTIDGATVRVQDNDA